MRAIGFSTSTCLPASIAAIAQVAWELFQVQIEHAVDLVVGEQLVRVARTRGCAPYFLGHGLRTFEVDVGDGDQLDVGILRVRGEVGLGDAAGADDADSELRHEV